MAPTAGCAGLMVRLTIGMNAGDANGDAVPGAGRTAAPAAEAAGEAAAGATRTSICASALSGRTRARARPAARDFFAAVVSTLMFVSLVVAPMRAVEGIIKDGFQRGAGAEGSSATRQSTYRRVGPRSPRAPSARSASYTTTAAAVDRLSERAPSRMGTR